MFLFLKLINNSAAKKPDEDESETVVKAEKSKKKRKGRSSSGKASKKSRSAKKEKEEVVFDILNLKKTMFDRGLSKDEAIGAVACMLKLTPYCEVGKYTKHRNFIRNIANLIVFVYYCQSFRKLNLLAMNDGGVGFVSHFEKTHPHKHDITFKREMLDVYMAATTFPECNDNPWNPNTNELLNWSGNMHNYVYTQLRQASQKGLFHDDEDEIKGGLYIKWYMMLQSLGIEFCQD